MEKLPCVTLGGKHLPVPVPLIQDRGKTCVPLNSSADWLQKIVGVGSKGETRLVVKEFIDGVLACIAGAAAAKAAPGGDVMGIHSHMIRRP